MPDAELTLNDLKALEPFDTPTICNALEVIDSAFRGYGFSVEPFVCPFPQLPPIVGYAKTCLFRSMRPVGRPGDEVKAQRQAYYDYVGAGPRPTIAVVQDLDNKPGFGAFWGEVNTHIHQGLGCAGTITNGSIRDLDAIAPGFQMLAGMVNPSHGWGHIEDFGVSANVHGMTVHDGDVIHADRHGAVVIPHELVKQVPAAVDLMARREAVILTAAKKPGFTAAKLKQAMGDAEEIH